MSLNISELEVKLQYTFLNKELLHEALVHTSYAHENGLSYSNERLEFLGDAVLHLILTEFLMATFHNDNEGRLSELRSYCESENVLYKYAMDISLGKFILFGKGEQLSGGQFKKSLQVDAFEAVIAAIHSDGGYEAAKTFVLRNLRSEILAMHEQQQDIDSKSELQKLTQKFFKILPIYTVLSEQGLDHNKMFQIQVQVVANGQEYNATGIGSNKKAAEKEAARNLINKLDF